MGDAGDGAGDFACLTMLRVLHFLEMENIA
jgi:hypothetical protein